MQPFLAMIQPLTDPRLEVGGGPIYPTPMPPVPGQPPLGIWGGPWQPPYPSQGPGFPTHPIAPGGPPLGIWGPPQMPPGIWPSPPPGMGGQPPYPSQGPGFPTHPIAGLPGGGGGGGQPGIPTHPIYNPPYPSQGPGFPTHPIVLPPPPGSGEGAPPIAAQLPVFPPEATHPIVLPPEVAPPTTPDGRPIDWKAAWSPMTGWVVVGVPSGEHPTPSK